MGRTFAGILGYLAFTAIVARSILNGSDLVSTMKLASCCLFAFAALGWIIGQLADYIVLDSVRSTLRIEFRKQQNQSTHPNIPIK